MTNEEFPPGWVPLEYARVTKCLDEDSQVQFWVYISPNLNYAEKLGISTMIYDAIEDDCYG